MKINWIDLIKTILTLIPISLIINWISKHGKFSATITKPTTRYNTFKKYNLFEKSFFYIGGIFCFVVGIVCLYQIFVFLNNTHPIEYFTSALLFVIFFILGLYLFTKPQENKIFTTFMLYGKKYFIIGDREVDDFYICQTATQLYDADLPKKIKKIKKDKISEFSEENVSLESLKKYIDENK